MSSTSGATLIIDHLGGEQFLASLGARDFAIDDTHVGFTLVHENPKKVHSVAITVEPGGFKVPVMAGLRRALFVHRCLPWRTSPSLTVLQRFSESSPASTL